MEPNAIIGPSTQYCIAQDGPKRYRTDSTTPQDITNPQETLFDAYYEMYEKVTYKSVHVKVEPFLFDFSTSGSTTLVNAQVCHVPMVACQDVSSIMPLALTNVTDYSKYAVRGGKSFKIIPAKQAFSMEFNDLDRLGFQKYGKMLFETNAKWSSRERLTNAPAIQIGAFYPSTEASENQFSTR